MFKNFKKDFQNINSERELNDSDYYYVLELLDDLPFDNLFFLDCNIEEANMELFLFIENNGELVEEFDNLQLYLFDDKKIVLFNSFDEMFLFCKSVDVTEFSEVF